MERAIRVWKFLISEPVWLSAVEVVFTTLVSNAALPFLVFAYLLDTQGAVFSVPLAAQVIRHNVSSSEILVYMLALVAPTLWLMMANWRARKHAVVYTLLLILQIGIIALSAYMYGKGKFGGVANQAYADKVSIYCLIIGLVIWYITLVYDRWIPSVLKTAQNESGRKILDEL